MRTSSLRISCRKNAVLGLYGELVYLHSSSSSYPGVTKNPGVTERKAPSPPTGAFLSDHCQETALRNGKARKPLPDLPGKAFVRGKEGVKECPSLGFAFASSKRSQEEFPAAPKPGAGRGGEARRGAARLALLQLATFHKPAKHPKTPGARPTGAPGACARVPLTHPGCGPGSAGAGAHIPLPLPPPPPLAETCL